MSEPISAVLPALFPMARQQLTKMMAMSELRICAVTLGPPARMPMAPDGWRTGPAVSFDTVTGFTWVWRAAICCCIVWSIEAK
jgi:hypothetical protein